MSTSLFTSIGAERDFAPSCFFSHDLCLLLAEAAVLNSVPLLSGKQSFLSRNFQPRRGLQAAEGV